MTRQLADPSPTEYGARTELRLIQSSIATHFAEYEARWFLEERECAGTLQIQIHEQEGKRPQIQAEVATEDELPGWLLTFTKSLGSNLGRAQSKQGWPRRLARWRNPQKAE
ncbi:MAG: hypothetical protein MK135_00110 [Polyangiaceae bacterium]|nr:hypothetical protein [Polyangiaceae bacterium]